ncbi:KxYKxGKxW signal peptide domain-containing protein [Lentilactobacillus sp. Marseille-Q4993]|uniref:KxYKxGKxW signal peptide domain-containing protein n=1 Tax=Lentilactobacillus sp. Marseille-Q4993 TaxID=3039492 RepID=UPI0024BCF94C|nr:KxYKxGKxW signal peptide domain-containing protein [Lentilactobacillus sp. Marseille-Q4993]
MKGKNVSRNNLWGKSNKSDLHYKMYKSGKQWVFASMFMLSVGAFLMGSGSTVKADTQSQLGDNVLRSSQLVSVSKPEDSSSMTSTPSSQASAPQAQQTQSSTTTTTTPKQAPTTSSSNQGSSTTTSSSSTNSVSNNQGSSTTTGSSSNGQGSSVSSTTNGNSTNGDSKTSSSTTNSSSTDTNSSSKSESNAQSSSYSDATKNSDSKTNDLKTDKTDLSSDSLTQNADNKTKAGSQSATDNNPLVESAASSQSTSDASAAPSDSVKYVQTSQAVASAAAQDNSDATNVFLNASQLLKVDTPTTATTNAVNQQVLVSTTKAASVLSGQFNTGSDFYKAGLNDAYADVSKVATDITTIAKILELYQNNNDTLDNGTDSHGPLWAQGAIYSSSSGNNKIYQLTLFPENGIKVGGWTRSSGIATANRNKLTAQTITAEKNAEYNAGYVAYLNGYASHIDEYLNQVANMVRVPDNAKALINTIAYDPSDLANTSNIWGDLGTVGDLVSNWFGSQLGNSVIGEK